MAVNKVVYGNSTLMDVTDTTATSDEVLEGEVFYSANGVRSVGTLGDATTSTHGLMSASDKSKLDNITEGATANIGTITGITMNGASKGTSGIVDLGTIITEHQTIPTGSTSQVGIVQLNDTLTSTSNTQALTAKQGKVLNDKIEAFQTSTLRDIPFSISVNDWVVSGSHYVATVSSTYVTATSREWVTFDSSFRLHAKSDISIDKTSGGGGITLTTSVIPSGSIQGTLYVIDANDGKVPIVIEGTVMPIENGGTGQNTLSGAQNALGISALSDRVDTLDSKVEMDFGSITASSVAVFLKAIFQMLPDTKEVINGVAVWNGSWMIRGYRYSQVYGAVIATMYTGDEYILQVNGSLESAATIKTYAHGDQIDALNSNIANIAKLYRINVANENVASNQLFNLQADYLADSFITVTNNNEIHFSESANILVLATVAGKPSTTGRGWIKLQGGNTYDDAIAYGEYVTLVICATYAVSASTVLTIKNMDSDALLVGGGGITGSRIKIIRL